VIEYVTGPPGHGSLARSARAAGFGKKSSASVVARIAYRMSRDPRVIEAIAEESKKLVRVVYPEAANAMINLVRDPKHRDHGRAVMALVDRLAPTESRHSVEVVHKVVDETAEALEELRALRKLGTARDKLIELFGGNGLARLERLEVAETARRSSEARLIEGEVIEVVANG
jgi:hypothetical protein